MEQIRVIVGIIVIAVGLALILGGLFAFNEDIIGVIKGWMCVAVGLPVLGIGAGILKGT